MTTELFLQTVVNATYAASYMALIAVGLVLIFGVMGVINFAHGELYMAGSYAVVALYAGLGMPFFVAVAIGLIFVGLLGLLMEYGLFRPLRDNPLGGLIASIGFLLILQTIAVLGFGVQMEHVPPSTQGKIVFSDGVVLTYQRLYVIIATVVLLIGAVAVLAQEQVRLGAACLRAGPRGGSPPGHLDQRHRADSPCSSVRLSPASPARLLRRSSRRRRRWDIPSSSPRSSSSSSAASALSRARCSRPFSMAS